MFLCSGSHQSFVFSSCFVAFPTPAAILATAVQPVAKKQHM
jgi:hypothetical protein